MSSYEILRSIMGGQGLGIGSKNVTAAGTQEHLVASSTKCNSVIIQALRTNTEGIWLGDSSIAAGSGVELNPGESIPIAIDDLYKIWIDSDVSGEGVSFLYLKDSEN